MDEERGFKGEREFPVVKHEAGVTIRLDWDTIRELDRIALFEHDKRAPVLRRMVVEKVQVYLRMPAYKRFLKLLEDRRRSEQRTKRKGEE